jgi:hypothetical protein
MVDLGFVGGRYGIDVFLGPGLIRVTEDLNGELPFGDTTHKIGRQARSCL